MVETWKKKLLQMAHVSCSNTQMWINFMFLRCKSFGITFDSSQGIKSSSSFIFSHFIWFLPKEWLFSLINVLNELAKQNLNINLHFRMKARRHNLSAEISLIIHYILTAKGALPRNYCIVIYLLLKQLNGYTVHSVYYILHTNPNQ